MDGRTRFVATPALKGFTYFANSLVQCVLMSCIGRLRGSGRPLHVLTEQESMLKQVEVVEGGQFRAKLSICAETHFVHERLGHQSSSYIGS